MRVEASLIAVGRSRSIRLAAIAFVLLFVGWRWDRVTGFTGLPRFGEDLKERRLPALQTLPIKDSPHSGYDGQFYAQIAVEPNVTSPDLGRALDKPSYRLRRILLPLLAYGLGAGRPWVVLQIYALLNTAAWLWLAAVFWLLLPRDDWRHTVAWLGAMLSVGALDSVRLALTDLPGALLLVLATSAMERGRERIAAVWVLLAGFTREISVAAALLVRSAAGPRRTFILRAVSTGPVLLWCAWLAWRLPGPVGHEGNIDWPGFAFLRQLQSNLRLVFAGDFNPLVVFGVLGGLGLAAQSVYVLSHWRLFATNPWVRMALPFAVLFWLIGADPWLDYRAVARDCLPMTLVFNLLWARRADANPLWLLANVIVIDGVIRMTPP
jgi:hypothetical protein